ncbi:MAG: type II secretion system F family protein [Acidimicrobiales bacterium]|jgi:Flp pilus assembly protein TadB
MTAITTEELTVYGLGLAMGLGVTGLTFGLVVRSPVAGTDAAGNAGGPSRLGRMAAPGDIGGILVAVAVGIACFVATGWLVAGPIGGLAAYGVPRLMRQTSTATSIAKIEAVATWTEMLQGTLAASAGLGQAIVATAELSPAPIRDATERLAAQIQAGVHPRSALLRFADEVGDPCADRVVCSLLLAFASRAQRLGDLLGALADSTREEVSLRLRIETSRASIRSGVRTVVVFSVAFAVGLAVFDRAYLSPFDSAAGQIVLAIVAGLYAAGLTLMVALARPPKPVRLLGQDVVLR